MLHLLAFLAVLGAARLEAELAVLDVDAVDALAVEGELAGIAVEGVELAPLADDVDAGPRARRARRRGVW